jgi:hypothetical protein
MNFAPGSAPVCIDLYHKATDLRSARESHITMTKLQFKGGWNEVKGKLKEGRFAEGDPESLKRFPLNPTDYNLRSCDIFFECKRLKLPPI